MKKISNKKKEELLYVAYSETLTDKDIKVIHEVFIKYFTKKNYIFFQEAFFDTDEIAIENHKRIVRFCHLAKISFPMTIKILIDLQIQFLKFHKLQPMIKGKDVYLEELEEYYLTRIEKVGLIAQDKHINNSPSSFYQKILNNSYDEVEKTLKNEKVETPLNIIQLNNNRIIEIRKEIKDEKYTFEKVFENEETKSKIINNEHFFKCLKKERLGFTEDNKLIFKKYTKALKIGYRDKCILMNDKKIVISEIEKHINFLKGYEEDNEKNIKFLETLHSFMQQTKYKNYIPIHAVAKEMGLSESDTIDYAKSTLNSFNETSFENRINNIIHIPKK